MKKIIQTTSIALLTTSVLTACMTAPTLPAKPTPSIVNQPANATGTVTVTLAPGQNIFVKEHRLNLTFDKVLNDSRCPTGVQCIWAGNATVAVTAMTTASRPQTLYLSIGALRGDLRQTQRFANRDITLTALSSAPVSSQSAATTTSNLPTITLTVKQIP